MGDDGVWKLKWLFQTQRQWFKALSENESNFLLMGYVYPMLDMLSFLDLIIIFFFFLIQFLRGSSPCNRIWHHCMDHEQLRKTLAKKAWFFLNKRSIKLCQGLSRIPKEKLQSFYVSEAKINLSPKREDFKVQTAILAKKRWLYWIRFWCTCTVRSFRTKSILLTYMGMFIWFIDDVWYAPDHCHNISNQLLLRIKTAGMPSLHSLRKLKESLVKTLYKIPQNKKKLKRKGAQTQHCQRMPVDNLMSH